MVKVSHIEINKMVSSKMDTISNKEFFTSHNFSGYMEDIANNLAKRYGSDEKLEVKMVWEENNNSFIARTQGSTISINAGNHLLKEYSDRQRIFHMIRGLKLHELGHVFYSDFVLFGNRNELFISKKKIFPAIEPLSSSISKLEKDMEQMDQKKITVIFSLYRSFLNALEDAYVNERISNQFPGFRKDLLFVLDAHFSKKETYSQVVKTAAKNKYLPILIPLEMMHQYAVFGEIKCETKDWENEDMKFLKSNFSRINEIICCTNSYKRYALVNELFAIFYEKMMEQNKQNQKKDESKKNTQEKDFSGKQKDNSNSNEQKTTDGKEKKQNADTEKTNGNSDTLTEKDLKNIAERFKNISSFPEGRNSSPKEPAEMQAANGSSTQKRTSLSQKIHEQEKKNESKDTDTERILKEIVQESVFKELERMKEKELNEQAIAINQPTFYDNFYPSVTRMAGVTEELRLLYAQKEKIVRPVVKQMAEEFTRVLKKTQKGEKMTNLSFGRRIEMKSYIRQDGKCFSKKKLPSKRNRLTVAVLADESGSMRTQNRIDYTKTAALALYEFCKELEIPVTVYGHSTSGNKVCLNSYAEFENYDKNDKFRIMQMSAGGGNQDGYSLRFLAEKILSEKRSDYMLLIIISDGRPNGGSFAIEDIREVQKTYKRKGITIIAAAIGEDRDLIKDIYKENYLDITDLSEMPRKLVGIVRPYIK